MAASLPPYVFKGSSDWTAQIIKRLARRAEVSNPLTSGPYVGATVTWFTGSGTLTQQWTMANSPSAFVQSGGVLQAATSGTNYFAGPWIFPTAGNLSAIPPFNVNTDPRFYFSSTFGRVKFSTSAAAIEMHGSWADALSNFGVIVDGQYATPAGGLNPTAQGGISIVFASGRKDRIIEISGANNWGFRGMYTTSILDDVSNPGEQGPLWIFDGDSFTQGGGLATPVDPDAPWYQQACFLLGIDNAYPPAVTSTGYISTGNPFPGGTLTTMLGRLQGAGWNLVPANPAVIVAAGGYNDMTYLIAGNITQQQFVDAVVAYQRGVRAKYPKSRIIIMGPWSGARGPDAVTIAAEAAAQTAVNALGDSGTYFVPVCTSLPKPWVYGTGRTNNLTGDGNSDWCTGPGVPHPIAAGHAHLAQRFAAAVRPLIYSW